MEYFVDSFDVAVIGAGHAGIEAALAAARLGQKTIIFTISLDAVGNMPCNPSIGGTAKGHLVREIDALGGEMGRAADKVFLQSRMLNRGKGPAVHSLRIQADRRKYQEVMKETLEKEKNLVLKQAEIKKIEKNPDGGFFLYTHLGAIFSARAAIIATGTYLEGRIIVGDTFYSGGPDGMFAATGLSESLRAFGLEFLRFKTGTPARIRRSSVDLSQLEIQEGDENIVPFSFENEGKDIGGNKLPCYLVYTNAETHRIIRENLHRSPLFSGNIKGIGPRYCPSIEDKIVKFPDKERHQLFLEPMGERTEEMYLQGMSSSLPEDVQIAMIRSLKGFENAQIMRTAYAIEYDCVDPLELSPTLEAKKVENLYGAGQFNGTSGYEEAAAQGLIAGINASLKNMGKEPLILDRSTSYIGTLIDDLVVKGTNEPYRMMTSRSEYRLILRQDNADRRLTPIGHKLGLISEERYERFSEKQKLIEKETERMKKTFVPPSPRLFEILNKASSSPVVTGVSISDLIKRPELSYKTIAPVDDTRPLLPDFVTEAAETEIRYEGYIKRQKAQVEQFKKLEEKKLPLDFDYSKINGLRLEARQKLNRVKPANIGQASRISGVSPADVSVLLIYFGIV
ncbi:MAG: tRNA uridine-5-carboxymethylaminomethyl(34) synthesis enzyme MnmG [Clostridiales bacterium]|nr:tRNA uridine-5-carboxymethylaminomethyl(34) synthesis enzyme MnmG [Clostridiales bacterium]